MTDPSASERVQARQALILARDTAFLLDALDRGETPLPSYRRVVRDRLRAQYYTARRVLGEREYARAGGPELP